MIEVMLASRLTREGVDGVRWVLLEEAAAVRDPAPARLLADATVSAAALPGRSLRSVLVQGALAWFTYGLGMLLAVWLAYSVFGPPAKAGQAPVRPPVAMPLLGPGVAPAKPAVPAAPTVHATPAVPAAPGARPAAAPSPMAMPAPADAASAPIPSRNL